MKVYCDGLDLSNAVLRVVKAISAKNFNPILEGIKIVAENDTLIMTATDGDLVIEKTIKADVKVEGKTVVKGKFFNEYVRTLTNGTIELELNEKNQLKIKYNDSETFITCLNPDEYPRTTSVNNEKIISMKSKDLKRIIEKTVFSVATDDVRPVLKGAYFEVSDSDQLTVVALDGYRLAKATATLQKSVENFNFVFPGRNLKEFYNLLEDSEDIVDICLDQTYAMMQINGTKIISRLLRENFPNYKQILPKSFCSVITVDKNILMNSLEQGSILSRTTNDNKVILSVSEKILKLQTNNEIGTWSDNLSIILEGEDIELNFNINFIRDCLKVVDDEIIRFKISGRNSPCIIEGNSDAPDSMYLILPLRQR